MTAIELPPRAQAWLDLLRTARQAAKDAKGDEELAKRNLAELLGDAEEGTVEGRKVCSRKISVRQTLDTDRIRDEYPEVYEKCLRTTEITTLRVTT